MIKNEAPINDLLKGTDNLMQFTGLLDKQGVDIYEGDIVEYDNAVGFWYGEVKYINQYSAFRCVFNDGRWTDLYENIKVIGNIHENPELLKGE